MPWHTSTSSTTLYKLSSLTSSFPLCFATSLPLPRQLNFLNIPLQKENHMTANCETQALSSSSFSSLMLVKLENVSSIFDLLFLIQLFPLSLSLKIHTIVFSPLYPTNKYASPSYVTDKQYILFWLLIFYLSPFLSYLSLGSNPILLQVLLLTFLLNLSSLPLAFTDMHVLVFLYLLLIHFICRNTSFTTFKGPVLSFLSLHLELIHWPNPSNFHWLFFEKSYKSYLSCSQY